MNQDTYYGVIVIFYKNTSEGAHYLTVKNAQTGNVTFLSGAQEGDEPLHETARREIREELAIEPDTYSLTPTEVYQNFVFDENKKERAGARGSYQVFVADAATLGEIRPTKELKEIWWKNEAETLAALTFEDLKEVFRHVLVTGVFEK
jgi:8-oxo-dGTP pyrophosphatase MutT (NUDIX family)